MTFFKLKPIFNIKLILIFVSAFFGVSGRAQFYSHQINHWQIMRSSDKMSNHPAIRKFMPKGLEGKWTDVKETALLSNFSDWLRTEAKQNFKPFTIPWSTWFLKAPLFDSATISNGFQSHYKLRLNRLECAELEVYINEQKLDIVNPTFGQTFIDQIIDVTPFLKKDGKDTIFIGFISQMTHGLTLQRLEKEKFTADNETTTDSVEQLFYGGINGVHYDGKVKISPYFRRPIMDFGWDFAKPNIHFGLGKGIEVVGWNNLMPISSHVTTDSIIYNSKGKPLGAYVTYQAELDADFTQCSQNGRISWSPSFNFVVDRNFSERLQNAAFKGNSKALTVYRAEEDWVRMNDTSYDLLEESLDGFNYETPGKIIVTRKYYLKDPKLWYPNGYFQQVYPKDQLPTRYRIGLEYKINNGSQYSYLIENALVQSPYYTYTGIRTIQVDTANGRFHFVLNGKKITALGTNVVWGRENLNQWVEGVEKNNCDWTLHGETSYFHSINKPFTSTFYSTFYTFNAIINPKAPKPENKQFRAMFNLGMNMVRFWGGGNYPPEEVYQECDKLGILVWQDLMFSGTTYPNNKEWVESVGNEINHTVTWMKAHPSLALICGNNEIEVALKNWGWNKTYDIHGEGSARQWANYRQLFDTFIPRKLQKIAPTIFYLPSSPVGNWGNRKQMKYGDNHDWGIWHGERNFNHLDSVNAPFVSEFGFPSLPAGYKESTDSNNYALLPFRSYKGMQLLNRYAKTENSNKNKYLVFPSLSVVVQTSVSKSPSGKAQALFLNRAFRAYRTSSVDFGGCLFWQWNDVDRVVSWSLVDNNMKNKPAFEQLKYSLKPTVVFARSTDTSIRVSAQSMSLKSQKYTAKVYVMSPNKTMVFQMQKPIVINGFVEFTINVKSNVLLQGNLVHVQLVNASGKVVDEI